MAALQMMSNINNKHTASFTPQCGKPVGIRGNFKCKERCVFWATIDWNTCWS